MKPKVVTIAEATAEYPRHSEASILERADGSLMIAWQEYTQSERGSEDNAPNRISAMTSHDGGETWGERRTLLSPEPGDVNVYSPNFLRLPDGEVLLFNLRYLVLERGRPPATIGMVRRSRDEGRTFSDPEPLWSGSPLMFASSTVKRLSTGRIVMPVARQRGEVWTSTDHEVLGVTVSDDGGKSWQESQTWADLPMRGAMEPHVEELRDGRLLMVMRTQLGAVFQAHSEDGGMTWSKPQTTGLKAPESCPDLLRIPKTGDLMIVWNDSPYNPAFASHYGKRSPLTVAVSRDEGLTWTHRRNVEDDPARAYSNPGCLFTGDGKAILHYWTLVYTEKWRMDSGRIDLRAAIFDVDWLYS